MALRTFVILLALSLVANAGWLKPDVDFSNYDVPLYEQIVNRIKAKISNRLGEGTNTRDRYLPTKMTETIRNFRTLSFQ